MKRILFLLTFACTALFSACEYDDSEVWSTLNDYGNRISKLEALCAQMNTNISSLQTIVNALQQKDFITTVAPITQNGKEIGYSITFSSGKSITIYHGNDGKDGSDGSDGKDGTDGTDGSDGYTPKIGVKKDADGIYYWTIDGEWLTDDAGNKIQAQGKDGLNGGKDGEDGEDGKDGTDGADGKNGITPQLKIEDDYWYVSYDNGTTWTKLGKATGEDGSDGSDGSSGDNIFQSVTQDANNVYFKLANGTTITIPKSASMENIVLTYVPRYSDGKATVFYTEKSDSYVEFDFEVSPASAAANWRNIATVKAVYTETRAGVEFVDMAILAWTTDTANGTITVRASGKNLSDAFFAGTQDASARLVVSGDAVNIISEYVPMVRKKSNISRPAYNELFYTSRDGILQIKSSSFDANIITHTYDKQLGGIITFDKEISYIGKYTFENYHSLNSIIIPNSTKIIDDYAFSNCGGLNSLIIGENISIIGKNAFKGCGQLTIVDIPDNVISIKESAFNDCSRLENITFGKNVTDIESYAFRDCESLKTINLPNKVQTIGNAAFAGCNNLTNITLSNSIKEIKQNTFANCNNLTSITIPNGVIEIGNEAFYCCSRLYNITIPNSVKSIGSYTFAYCENLAIVYCKSSIPPKGSYAMFDGISSYAKIYVPVGSGAAYKAADGWKDYASMIEEKEM